MLKPVRLLAAKPLHDQLKPLPGALKPILARAIVWHVTLSASKIRCTSISQRLGRQDFISRRVNFAGTGAEVGDHVATFRGRR